MKHGRNAAIALRWFGAATRKAAQAFRQLKAHKQLPVFQAALRAIRTHHDIDKGVAPEADAAEGLLG